MCDFIHSFPINSRVHRDMKNRQNAEIDLLQGLQPFSYDDSGNSCGSSVVSDFTGNEDECVLQVSDLESEANEERADVLQVSSQFVGFFPKMSPCTMKGIAGVESVRQIGPQWPALQQQFFPDVRQISINLVSLTACKLVLVVC